MRDSWKSGCWKSVGEGGVRGLFIWILPGVNFGGSLPPGPDSRQCLLVVALIDQALGASCTQFKVCIDFRNLTSSLLKTANGLLAIPLTHKERLLKSLGLLAFTDFLIYSSHS